MKGSVATNMPGESAVGTATGQYLATHHSAKMSKVETAPLGTPQIQLKDGKL